MHAVPAVLVLAERRRYQERPWRLLIEGHLRVHPSRSQGLRCSTSIVRRGAVTAALAPRGLRRRRVRRRGGDDDAGQSGIVSTDPTGRGGSTVGAPAAPAAVEAAVRAAAVEARTATGTRRGARTTRRSPATTPASPRPSTTARTAVRSTARRPPAATWDTAKRVCYAIRDGTPRPDTTNVPSLPKAENDYQDCLNAELPRCWAGRSAGTPTTPVVGQ